MLFWQMDLLYGKAATFEKSLVLEIVARVPYQTWENASYKRITRVHRRTGLAVRIWDRVREFRAQQDNEQWHMLIMAELVERSGRKTGWLRFRLLPQLISIGWWHFCWLLYAVKPAWSHRLNADFEDHAEHTYAEMVVENPAFETTSLGLRPVRRVRRLRLARRPAPADQPRRALPQAGVRAAPARAARPLTADAAAGRRTRCKDGGVLDPRDLYTRHDTAVPGPRQHRARPR